MRHGTPNIRPWIIALLLLSPASIPYVVHFAFNKRYSRPTGYIQPDMPVYMAKAREYFDDGQFHIFYGNPCGRRYDEPRVYFQPWTFALGVVHRVTRLPPRILFPLFWLATAWGCARVALSLYDELVGLDTRAKRIGLILFFWGGGLLAISGAFRAALMHGHVGWDDLFALDPFDGWWFLNFGRNLIFPTESLYHLLVFASLFCAIKLRLKATVAFTILTCACSPFAGLELLAILGVWSLAETIFFRNRNQLSMLLSVILISTIFIAYYGFYLNQFAEHRRLESQMSLNWTLPLVSFIAAEALVTMMVIARVFQEREFGGNFNTDSRKSVFSDPRNRLLLAWALVAIVLSKHEWFVSPRQPLHFTRGYSWTALFFLGAPALIALIDRCLGTNENRSQPRSPGYRRLALGLIFVVFLSDNALWLARLIRDTGKPDHNEVKLSDEQRDVLNWLNDPSFAGSIVVSEDERLSFLTVSETPLRSWVGHHLETPGYAERKAEVERFFRDDTIFDSWRDRPLLIVRYRRQNSDAVPRPPALGAKILKWNRKFSLEIIIPNAK